MCVWVKHVTASPGRESTEYTCIQSDINKTFGHFHSSSEWKPYSRWLHANTALLEVMKASFFFKKKHIKIQRKELRKF